MIQETHSELFSTLSIFAKTAEENLYFCILSGQTNVYSDVEGLASTGLSYSRKYSLKSVL